MQTTRYSSSLFFSGSALRRKRRAPSPAAQMQAMAAQIDPVQLQQMQTAMQQMQQGGTAQFPDPVTKGRLSSVLRWQVTGANCRH
jgi:hypothetical protein